MGRICWVDRKGPGRVGVTSAPRGGAFLDDELKQWREDGCDIVVSLQEEEEAESIGLLREREVAEQLGMEFTRHPVSDFGIPEPRDLVLALVRRLAGEVRKGRSVAVHCRAGIGRAPSLAACVLIALGEPGKRALDLISDARGFRVPETPEQRDWVLATEPDLR